MQSDGPRNIDTEYSQMFIKTMESLGMKYPSIWIDIMSATSHRSNPQKKTHRFVSCIWMRDSQRCGGIESVYFFDNSLNIWHTLDIVQPGHPLRSYHPINLCLRSELDFGMVGHAPDKLMNVGGRRHGSTLEGNTSQVTFCGKGNSK